MPVHSKPFSGRAKNAPPLLGPKPYKKTSQLAWKTPDSPILSRFINRAANNNDTVDPTNVQLSELRRPSENSPNVPKSPPVVRFGEAEVIGEEGLEPVRSDRELKDQSGVESLTAPTTQMARTVMSSDSILNGISMNSSLRGFPATSFASNSNRSVCYATTSASTLHGGHSVTPVSNSNLSGAQALQECEDHTDWANEVLAWNKLPLISDLRKSIGDGFTLPTILEIIGGVSLSCVKTNPATKEDRVHNILHSLKFLCKRGVDITGIQPTEIEDGHLRAVLNLVGNIRQHFKNTYRPEQNGTAHSAPASPEITSKPPPVTKRNMPGAMKLPGAIPTPFLSHVPRNSLLEAPTKTSVYHEDEILPGVLGRDANSNDTSKPHFNIISTTEIGTNGVAQHGVDERKNHFANNNNVTNRGMVIRHPNAKTSVASTHEPSVGPPSVTQRAWTGSPRLQAYNVNGSSTSPSVEDRLKNLLNSGSSRSGSRDNLGYFGGGFHGGSSEIVDDDDGEILIVPQPMSRNSADFEVAMLGEHGYGPGYRPISSQHSRQTSQQGYVPSKPSDRVQGSRAEVIISRPPSAIAFRKSAPSRAAPQNVPGTAPGSTLDSGAYVHGGPSPNNYANRGNNAQVTETAFKPPSPLKAGSNDLRNAWHKLYGPQAQVPPPYGSTGMNRGDQLRSSYGQQSQHRLANNTGQHSVTFAKPPAEISSRPVSAPAPAHMQAYFQVQEQHLQDQGQSHSQDNLDNQGHGHTFTSHQRESPMGQSSSTQGHLDESSSSQQSRLSQEQVPKHLQVQTSTDNNYGKLSHSSHSSLSQPSPASPGSPTYAIGPASKYPDNPGSRPSSARKPPVPIVPASPSGKHNRPRLPLPHQTNENVNKVDRRHANIGYNRNNFSDDLTTALQAANKDLQNSRGYNFDDSHDLSHDLSHDFQNHSIFDYNAPSRSESTGSVTPPLPPLSPTNTPPDSPQFELSYNLPRSISATNVSSTVAMFDEADGKVQNMRKPRRTSEVNFRMERANRGKKMKSRGYKQNGANLNDVKESGTDSDSNISFDIDDTILTVESHETEQLHHPAGDILSSRDVSMLRDQIHDLEFKYHDLQTKVMPERLLGHRSHQHVGPGKGQPLGPPPIGRQRRWSIGSSDTSSFRREAKYKPGKQIHYKHYSKEFKNINKRFQRLESHVVTLARSVAHLSSELRTHTTMVNDLETVKRELRDLRDNPSRPFPNMIDRTLAEQERFRDWVPALTNPKRVNKLTKFFGSEPPLLELFLEKLGYKKFASNFQSEHIGMIELPYMTEDRLEKIGIPMGPRIRILQEAQCSFRRENMNIYLV